MNGPVGLAFDTNGNLYAINSWPAGQNPQIVKFTSSDTGSIFASTALDSPEYLAFDQAGNLYVANSGFSSNNIVKFTPGGVSSVFAANNGNFANPYGLAFDSYGRLFVGNFDGNNGGFIEELATNGGASRFATTTLATPQGLAVDSAGNVYVANNNLATVERFTTNGVASLFAYSSSPYGVAVDGSNNVYVSDNYDNVINKFAPNGSGSVFATNGLINPEGLAFDSLGNLYAVNGGTNSIARFDTAGHFSVFATNGTASAWFGPDLAIDSANHVYGIPVPTYAANNIVKYTPAGVPSDFAIDADLNPQGMAFDSASNLYVANYIHGTIEKIAPNGSTNTFFSGLIGPTAIAIQRGSIAVIPRLLITHGGTNVLITWTLAAPNYTLQSNTNLAGTNWIAVPGTPDTNNGNYLLTNGVTGSARYFRLKSN